MKLSKKFTTVTPFSKTVAMALFILFPFVGFCLGIAYEQKVIPHSIWQERTISSTSPSIDPNSAAYFVKTYYTMYVDCLNLQSLKPCTSLAYNSNFIDPALLVQLQQEYGGDPILCTSNIPPSISVETQRYSKNGIEFGLQEHFQNESPLMYITVTKGDNTGHWRIIHIQCPQNK